MRLVGAGRARAARPLTRDLSRIPSTFAETWKGTGGNGPRSGAGTVSYGHARNSESGQEARLMPVQDAGLYAYLRTLDQRFA